MATINGTSGNDTLTGTASADTISGLDGDDTIWGGGGDDTLLGGDGNDIIHDTDNSTMNGGSGNDAYYIDSSYGAYVLVNISDTSGTDILYVKAGLAIVNASGVEQVVLSITQVAGNVGSNLLLHTSDNVTVTGSAGSDSIWTGSGNDTINGGDGDDSIIARGGADTINGGNGNDSIAFESTAYLVASGVTVNLATGTGSGGDAQGDTYTSIEIVASTRHADTLIGDGNVNELYGRGGDDTLSGGGGNDRLYGDTGSIGVAGNDVLDGGDGDDYLVGGMGADTISGGNGNDTLAVDDYSSVAVTVDLLAGTASGGDMQGDTFTSIENLTGAKGNDTLSGDNGVNVIEGKDGNDTLSGRGGNDTLTGGNGNDTLNGGTGNDAMTGGAGDDIYYVDSYSDAVTEASGKGTDTVRVDLYDYTLGANVENLEYVGLDYIEATGNELANVLTLGAVEDTAYGGDGNDTLYGMAGDDVLFGEDGDDIIVGSYGADAMIGGGGADTFVFSGEDLWNPTGSDYIWDFEQGTDTIDLSAMDAVYNLGDDAFAFIGTGAFTGTAGQLRYSASGGMTTIEGDVDGDGTADFTIELVGTYTLAGSDFVL